MAQKPETVFRTNRVRPDLLALPNTAVFAIQQKTIRGDPDFILCINGMFIALELKSEDGEAAPLQAYKLETVRRAKGIGIVATPDSWPQAYDLLKEIACSEVELPYNQVQIN